MDWSTALAWFDADDAEIARRLVQHGIAAIAFVAFWSMLNQFRPLLGERGLLPVPDLLEVAERARPRKLLGPTLFRWGYSDRRLVVVCVAGMAVAASVVLGLPQLGPPWVPVLAFLALWGLYLSLVSVGQTFTGFGWEMLLCEALFLVAFLGSDRVPPPLPVLVLLWWLVFRLEFGAGMIKIRGGREWRDLTALMYHHETQPMPGPLSRWAHLLPAWFHRLEVVGNHVAQLAVPWLLFAPQPVRSVAAAVIIATQLWLVATGNFAWLNWITVVLACAALGDEVVHAVLPFVPADLGSERADVGASPPWWVAIVGAVTLLLVVLSWPALRNLFSRHQLMNASFTRWQLANAYGAFGTVTKERVEYLVEGTLDDPRLPDAAWLAYEFKGKPGDPRRVPGQFAPYHLRLDWLMWFLPLGRRLDTWFLRFLERLLEADAATVKLLRTDPFDGRPPRAVRVRSELYRFATRAEHRETGEVWRRHPLGTVVPPIMLGEAGER